MATLAILPTLPTFLTSQSIQRPPKIGIVYSLYIQDTKYLSIYLVPAPCMYSIHSADENRGGTSMLQQAQAR